MELELIINNTKMGFLSFFYPKNRMEKRVEKNPNPLFLVRHMVLALDKLPPGRAYLHPHMDRTKVLKKIVKINMVTKINI